MRLVGWSKGPSSQKHSALWLHGWSRVLLIKEQQGLGGKTETREQREGPFSFNSPPALQLILSLLLWKNP